MQDLGKSAYKRPRSHFKWLLVLLMSLFLVYPIIAEHIVLRGLFDIFLLGIFFGAIRVATDSRRNLLLVISLGLLAIILRATNYVIDTEIMSILTAISYISFFLAVAIIIIRHALRAEQVNDEKICAAISAYIFLVLAWSSIYALVESCIPGSFLYNEELIDLDSHMPEFTYFSVATMTTLGYGDIVPVNHIAKSYAMLQAIVGPLFMAVLLARLVALHVMHREEA